MCSASCRETATNIYAVARLLFCDCRVMSRRSFSLSFRKRFRLGSRSVSFSGCGAHQTKRECISGIRSSNAHTQESDRLIRFRTKIFSRGTIFPPAEETGFWEVRLRTTQRPQNCPRNILRDTSASVRTRGRNSWRDQQFFKTRQHTRAVDRDRSARVRARNRWRFNLERLWSRD